MLEDNLFQNLKAVTENALLLMQKKGAKDNKISRREWTKKVGLLQNSNERKEAR